MLKNKIVMVLLSALVAFGLWVYVVTVEIPDFETTIYDIPVTMEGEVLLEDRGLVLMTERLPKVDLKLYGNRSDLNQLDNTNITLKVDLTKVYEAGEHSLTFSIGYPGNINGNEIQVQNRNPSRVTVKVEPLSRKEIPVEVVYTGEVKEGYMRDQAGVILDHATVLISGPESAVADMAKAVIQVDLTDRTESFSESYRYTLCNAQGEPVEAGQVVTNVAEVNHTMIIQKVKEISLRVNLQEGGGATKDTVDVTLSHKTIQVAGSEAALEGLEELVIGTIDLSTLSGMTRIDLDLSLPAGVTNLTGVTKVSVVVRVKERQTKTFEIAQSQIQLLNIPEGMQAKLMNQTMTITIRGTQEQLSQMTAADIQVKVDLSGQTQGLITLKPTIILADKYVGAGPLNAPSVSVELTPAADPALVPPQITGGNS